MPIAPIVLLSISPILGLNIAIDNPCSFTLTGTGFITGCVVTFSKTGSTSITAASVVLVSSTTITGTVNITNVTAGQWNVTVTTTETLPRITALSNAFSVVLFEPITVLADVIESELGLTDAQITIYNQKYNIPTSKGLFIVLSIVSTKVISVSNFIDSDGYENQQVSNVSLIQIDAMSANDEARQRSMEIIGALGSITAQNVQSRYGFKISQVPMNFNDASGLEETARLNRYTMTLNLFSLYTKTKTGSYYTQISATPSIDKI